MATASHFSRIWQAKKASNTIQELLSAGKTKQELKADSMLVAIAVSRGAECIYSHDEGVRKFGEDYILVQEIPFIPKQENMFG